MQTRFTPEQLADPHMAASEKILRTCVHCGFCTATCPTFTLLGDELDSPRGRIYLIKDMLENDRPATELEARHVDRCLSCLSCMTTCPSGVHYMHLVDHARAHIEKTYKRPFPERMLRRVLAFVLPSPMRFRAALAGTKLIAPFADRLARLPGIGDKLKAMLALAPKSLPVPVATTGLSFAPARPAAATQKIKRVALLTGCAQSVLDPGINSAAVRLLNRAGVAVTFPKGEGCCGALEHHMGREEASLAAARRNVVAWEKTMADAPLDAIVVTASGCGTTVKDYGFMLRADPAFAERAAKISALAKDISEVLAELDLGRPSAGTGLVVAYHSACSLQHGQKIKDLPKKLLAAAGFVVREPAEAHLCCGSAGTYNLLQPDIATQLRDRKTGHLSALNPDVIAAGNIGCMTQIGSGIDVPVVHTVELLDWAHGGPRPAALGQHTGAAAAAE
ncbi:glycolate oxidase subunit GlcF [Segnochrobactraceae bacterium EtOH-i3]